MSSTNFNYQVALKEGLKNLQQGRLRQAEQSFRYLVDKFPGAEGGYRGLAKVHFEQEDRAGALKVLREGAAALTKSGERSAAIGLLREAVALDSRDLATHRRLAAALALAGDVDAAVQEYVRFIRDVRDAGDVARAKTEAAYALGQLRDTPGVSGLPALADGVPAPVEPSPVTSHARSDDRSKRDEPARADARRESDEPAQASADPWLAPRPATAAHAPSHEPVGASPDDPWSKPPPIKGEPAAARFAPVVPIENDPWESRGHGPATSDVWTAPQEPAADRSAAAAEPPAAFDAGAADASVEEEVPPPEPEVDPVAVEAAAARYLATRDPRAAGLALEAARHYLAEGQTDAASDLLLQLIASGVADHDAQKLLVEVARTLGKREVARTKCQLLVQALLLDGRSDLAAEVEALAAAD